MSETARPVPAFLFANARSLLLPAGAMGTLFIMLVPLPGVVLDLLLALSITASLLLFLTAVQVRKATDLSVIPTLLLLLTLFRLSLNLASSRRILLHGSEGTGAAGQVIQAFGQFVVGGNYVVGFVLFLALAAIQFLVVSHGAVRTAEVTARFTLEALPGKQMAIDADMNAGLIDELEARRRREAIAREADFYGAMDGAARFNQRDAIATILITAINILAGLLIGVIQQGADVLTAVKTYTILTVGDGLVTMIPSLLVSVAGGLVLTRASSAGTLDQDLSAQIFARRNTMFLAGGVLAAMAMIPGLPKVPFLLVALALALFARRLPADQLALAGDADSNKVKGDANATAQVGDDLAGLLKVDELTLEIGFQLIPLVDEKQGGQMLNRVRSMRRHRATDLGFIVPSVHITDNLRLRPREYVMLLRGVEIGRWQTEANCLLAVNADPKALALPGIETREPAFGVSARWIEPGLEERALAAGYSVVDQTAVIGTHVAELTRRYAHQLLGRAETKRLLDSIIESHPKLMEELLPKLMSMGEIQKVLQQLLREQVSIRDLGTILETMVEAAAQSKHVVFLTEAIRQALGRSLVKPLLDSDGGLPLLMLDRATEEQVMAIFDPEGAARLLGEGASAHASSVLRPLLESVKRLTGDGTTMAPIVLLCPSPARYHLRCWLEPFLPKITVLAPAEIPPEVRVKSLGTVGGTQLENG